MPFTRAQIEASQRDPDQSLTGRWRAIFLDILQRAKSDQSITYAEGEHLYRGLSVSRVDTDRPENISGCDNYRFVFLFLTYAPGLNGASQILNYKKQHISIGQKQLDIATLYQFASKWEPVIINHNHPTDALRIIAKEARFELKELDSDLQFHEYGFFRRCNMYDARRRRIILHSKFVYCKFLEVFEELPPGSNIFHLNGSQIEFTEFSYLHILFRHYAQIIKQTEKPDKSYHNEDFHPNTIIEKLNDIFAAINNSGFYVGQDLSSLNFQYNGTDYKVYFNQRQRSVRGAGAVTYWRLETFFPVEDEDFIEDLTDNYVRQPINDTLSVYVK